jgi:hypothetical protein
VGVQRENKRMTQHFGYAVDRRYLPLLLPFRFKRDLDGVTMGDDRLSFGTNHNAGVCIHFAEKVPSRLSRSGHSELTVTVEDIEGLTRALGGDPDVAA